MKLELDYQQVSDKYGIYNLDILHHLQALLGILSECDSEPEWVRQKLTETGLDKYVIGMEANAQ